MSTAPRYTPAPDYQHWPAADLITEGQRLISLMDRAAREFKHRAALPAASHTGYESFASPELEDELTRLVTHLHALIRTLAPPGARRPPDYGYPRDEHAHHLGAA